jgi:hypothetical protein
MAGLGITTDGFGRTITDMSFNKLWSGKYTPIPPNGNTGPTGQQGDNGAVWNTNVNPVAIGVNAGGNNQGIYSIAIGVDAGRNNQDTNSIAIGYFAGNLNQSFNSIAIGNQAGQSNQNPGSIAVGYNSNNTGQNSVVIGYNSVAEENCIVFGHDATSSGHTGCIVLNADSVSLSANDSNTLVLGGIKTIQAGIPGHSPSMGDLPTLNTAQNIWLPIYVGNNKYYIAIWAD